MQFWEIINNGVIPTWCGNQMSALGIIGCVLLCMIPAYLLGSLNFGIILSHRLFGEDVRTKGSGNAGTTNMLRSYGKKAAVLTLVGDIFKAIVACCIGYFALGVDGAYLAGMFAVLGHMFPLYYRFKGGKGVATAAAMILMTNPLVFLIILLIFAVIVIGTKFVSLASIMSALLWPLILSRIEGAGVPFLIAFAVGALVVFMHRANIMRLYRGQENKISFGKKKEKKEDSADE
ncbi:MAG: glycerol-3-phosphate 1-O-acyltransferase PlsY [Clostridia bacterium]|nr:glycerol-3-phosphate 1-O-acyltransferase PlsY [Clostridia bacterium]